jgi:N-acetylglucosaminyl-diphospho-decaprenol L-rhamnosyltransferase
MIEDNADTHLCISIVSHGHKNLIHVLVNQLAIKARVDIAQLIITCNRPDLERFDDFCADNALPFKVQCIYNERPLGFGKNHNNAFKYCSSKFFCVMNPDIEIIDNPFQKLCEILVPDNIGCSYPVQITANGPALDYERELANPLSIAKRYLSKVYPCINNDASISWASGSFMVFRSSTFGSLFGFDERYFMYCEDVDICLRMQLAGYKLARADATVIHHTQRRTLKNPKHLAWHIRSLLRLWNSTAYKEYKRKFIDSRK